MKVLDKLNSLTTGLDIEMRLLTAEIIVLVLVANSTLYPVTKAAFLLILIGGIGINGLVLFCKIMLNHQKGKRAAS